MSGIVGYIGGGQAKPVILDALERLEYRGYDSAGIGILSNGKFQAHRTLGRPVALVEKLAMKPLTGSIGIGHTRWATHGKPSIRNAHPIVAGRAAVVHNGIIDNDTELKKELVAEGLTFRTETDTEIIPQMIDAHWQGTLLDTVLHVIKRMKGRFTFIAVSERDPECMVAVRMGNPLVVGFGSGERIVASDAPAVAPYTDHIVFLEDGDVTYLSHEGAQFYDFDGNPVLRAPQRISWEVIRSEKKGYRHFLLKEIVETPRAVRETLGAFFPISSETITPEDFTFPDIGRPKRVIFLGSGSSHHAAMVGQWMCDNIGGVSTGRKVSSEFRLAEQLVERDALYVGISQSGESSDTVAAARLAVEHGAKLLGITNQQDSSLARLSHYPIITNAGPEVSVVASKTFTATLAAIACLAYHLGRMKKNPDIEDNAHLLREIRLLPEKMELTITHETKLRRLAERYAGHRSFFFAARGTLYPLTQYASLMMKEVVNVHGEGLLAGEFKHGSISFVSPGMPVVFFANHRRLVPELLNDMDEIRARGAEVIAFGREDIPEMIEHCDAFIPLPAIDDRLSSFMAIAPAQLFIYYLGLYNRRDVDRPRNIAKSVTV